MLFLTRTASRLACNWQQGRSSTAAIFGKCSLTRLGSMGSVALHNIVSNSTVMGRASSAIVIRLHWSLRHHQRGKCSRHTELQTTGRQSVSSIASNRSRFSLMTLLFYRSFLQSLCVLGYCLFPLDIAAFIATFVRILWIRLPICLLCFAWSVYGKCARQG